MRWLLDWIESSEYCSLNEDQKAVFIIISDPSSVLIVVLSLFCFLLKSD